MEGKQAMEQPVTLCSLLCHAAGSHQGAAEQLKPGRDRAAQSAPSSRQTCSWAGGPLVPRTTFSGLIQTLGLKITG